MSRRTELCPECRIVAKCVAILLAHAGVEGAMILMNAAKAAHSKGEHEPS